MSGKLRSCKLDGTEAGLLVEYSFPSALASDGANLFVALGGYEKRIDRVDPKTFVTTTLGGPFAVPYALRVDDSYLYFIDQGKGTQRLSKTDAMDTLLLSKVDEPSTVEYKLGLGANFVYPATYGTIYRCAKGEVCTPPKAAITQQENVDEIVESEAGALVWINGGSDIRTCPDPKSGCASALVIASAALLGGIPKYLALRGDWLFVATTTVDGGGQLRRCKMSACASTMESMVTGDQVVAPMTFDKKAIYWIGAKAPPAVGPSPYRVMKLALPVF